MSHPRGYEVTFPEYDLVVKSSAIVTPSGTVSGQIAVRGEKIAGVFTGDEALPAKKTIDARSKPVIPGLVDTHCHFRDPGYTHK